MKTISAHSVSAYCQIKEEFIHPHFEMNMVIVEDIPDFDDINGEIAMQSSREKISFYMSMESMESLIEDLQASVKELKSNPILNKVSPEDIKW